ncbi:MULTISPECIES: hypothetical protein [unclassified Microbacterium]|uniref:hypothetical protein n=1 Tax=unclassified Microbacterium TaxID=2609290 RepID=UPI001781BAD5|nr:MULTISPECIES: hypothetical protein [unclassified Microbacterium]MBD8207359.1 hypothetical protein [Microbacterium sp. CFBP 8801]MBD8479728.1 hypothetical protein [Microbacterium sp. CFBP 8794]MBD8511012.1 hypothetical protein [Microbacterium sp. CFBP 8790]
MTTVDGEDVTRLYGPFLPHVGSATTSFVDDLENELAESGRYVSWDTSIEHLFIGVGESDCEIRPTRRHDDA